jgi:hypothetical protein
MVGREGHKGYKGLGPKHACSARVTGLEGGDEESFVAAAPALDPAAAP